jgi:hypothetical protein
MKNLFFGVIAVSLMASVPSAFAKGGMMSACKKELKKFGCEAKTEAAAHECLEQHEAHGKKNDGFSHGCYEAHESYEKKMGKEEKGEEHHDESSEHKE